MAVNGLSLATSHAHARATFPTQVLTQSSTLTRSSSDMVRGGLSRSSTLQRSVSDFTGASRLHTSKRAPRTSGQPLFNKGAAAQSEASEKDAEAGGEEEQEQQEEQEEEQQETASAAAAASGTQGEEALGNTSG